MSVFLMIGVILVVMYILYGQYLIYKNGGKVKYLAVFCALISLLCAIAIIVIKSLGLA